MRGADLKRDTAIIAICIAVYALAGLPVAGSMTDDTYIHMQYARNLAETGEISFNRGDPSYGATSPLWVFILALVHAAGGDISVWCLILSWAAGAGSIALMYLYMRKVYGSRLAAACASTVLACDAWLLRWSATGMESSLALLAVLACLYVASIMRSPRRSALFGIMLFLAFMVRPEAALLAGAAFISFGVARRGSDRATRFAWLAVFVVLAAAWLAVVKTHTGSFLPLTAGAKQGSSVLGSSMLTGAIVTLKIIGATLLLPAVAAAWFSFSRVFRGRMLPQHDGVPTQGGILLLVLWVFLLPAVYVVFDFHVLSRYLLIVTPAIIAAGMIGVSEATCRAGGRLRSAAVAAVAVITIAQSVGFYFAVVVRPTREFSRGLQDVLVPMGKWLERNSAPGSVVATPDIGAIGYFSRREVLDLGGLVTPEINDMRRRIDVEKIIDEGLYLDLGADFLVDRDAAPSRFEGRVINGYRFIPLQGGVVSNLGIRKPDPVAYTLYRIERAGGPDLRSGGGEER